MARDGDRPAVYSELDTPSPVNKYGLSKSAMDNALLDRCANRFMPYTSNTFEHLSSRGATNVSRGEPMSTTDKSVEEPSQVTKEEQIDQATSADESGTSSIPMSFLQRATESAVLPGSGATNGRLHSSGDGESKEDEDTKEEKWPSVRAIVFRPTNIIGEPAPRIERPKFLQWLAGRLSDDQPAESVGSGSGTREQTKCFSDGESIYSTHFDHSTA